MTKIDYRRIASEHLRDARALLAEQRTASTRYACLELRMAIEALVYDLLESYSSEVSATAMTTWQPKKIMRELIYVDPEVEEDRTITITIPAKDGETERKIDLGNEHRLSMKWADKAHNALGAHLHKSILRDIAKEESHVRAMQAKAKAEEVIDELDKILSSSVARFRAYRHVKFDCKCGEKFVCDVSFLEAAKEVVCPFCGRHFTYGVDVENNRYWYDERMVNWKCSKCLEENQFPYGELLEDTLIKCRKCGRRNRVERPFTIKPLD